MGDDASTDPGSTRELLTSGLAELGPVPDAPQINALLALGEMLGEWSRRMNLTAHRSPGAIVRRMLLDAAALGAQVEAAGTLADIGSGAGFPGIPLAILWPETRVTLVEPRRKRHHFQRAVVRELELTNVTMRLGRSEDLAPEPHAAVVGQALAAPGQALEWMLPWLEVGGELWLPGSREPARVPERPGVEFVVRHEYRVPLAGAERSLWVGRRTE